MQDRQPRCVGVGWLREFVIGHEAERLGMEIRDQRDIALALSRR
jgi:hypothetical protein